MDMRTYKATFHMAGNGDSPIAFACVTTVGIWGFRFALVNHGPVIIQKDLACDAINSFIEYLSKRYVFAKFSPKDAVAEKNLLLLDELNVQRCDSFPFYAPPPEALLVEAVADSDVLIKQLSPTARRMVRKASRSDYEITTATKPEDFESVWHLFEMLSERKGFTYRPLRSYLNLIRYAGPHELVRIYTAKVNNEPVQSILILLDGNWAWYVSGALNVSGIIDNASPSFLLHFHAMQSLANEFGDLIYNLGTRSGKVEQFKSRFRPTLYEFPAPVTVVFDSIRYELYRNLILKYQAPLRSHAKKVGRILLRRS